MHPDLSLNLMCFDGTGLGEDVAFVAEAGFSTIGIPWIRIEETGRERSLQLIARSGLAVSTIGVSRMFTLHEPDVWPDERASLLAALEFAADCGAETVYGPVGPALGMQWEEAQAAVVRATAEVVSRSEQVKVPLILEQTVPLYADLDFVHTFHDAVDVARSSGLGLCLDLFPTWQERDLLVTAADALPTLHLVQVGDFPLGTRQIPDRAVPGDGIIPLARIIGGLRDLGYAGRVDLELLGPRIRHEGIKTAALRSGQYMTELLESLGPGSSLSVPAAR